MGERVPTVSVAVKAHNHAPYVAQAMRSLLDQTFGDFEIVITDDGSTDATPEIIAGFSDERIRFERFEDNRGIVATMNATVQRARGEFVAILNSDDYAFAHRLETQVALLRDRPEVAAVFSVPREIDEAGEPSAPYGPLFRLPFARPDVPRADWLRHFFFHGNSLCAPSAMIRRSVYDQIGPDDPRFFQLMDLDRWVRLLERHEIYVMAEPLIAYRWRADLGNASALGTATYLRSTFESLQIFRRYRDFAPDFLRAIFAPDIARHTIDASGPSGVWLAEIALLGTHPLHRFFALESLFGAAAAPGDLQRLRELAGRINAFGLDLSQFDAPP